MRFPTMLAATIAAGLLICAPAAAQKISDLPPAATLTGSEKVPAIQGSGCASHVAPCSNVALTVTQLATLAGSASQPLDAELTALAGQTTAADKCQYWSASAAAALFGCTSFARGLGSSADAAGFRAAIGLGTLATQSGTFSGASSGTNTGDQTRASLGAAATADVQVFSTSGTWTKPAGAVLVRVIVFGGGGAGAAGLVVATATAAPGGGGGGGVFGRDVVLSAAPLGSTESVTIGAGGSSGTPQGGTSSFGSWVASYGGGGGSPGSAGNNSAGGGSSGFLSAGGNASGSVGGVGGTPNGTGGGVGGGGNSNAGGGGAGSAPYGAVSNAGYAGGLYTASSGGGGSGGGLTSGNATTSGGAGGSTAFAPAPVGGVAPGGSGATATALQFYSGGVGGSGGASSTTGNGGAGGAGQVPGGGGGGGGAAQTGATGGAGGAGGAGRVVVITTF